MHCNSILVCILHKTSDQYRLYKKCVFSKWSSVLVCLVMCVANIHNESLSFNVIITQRVVCWQTLWDKTWTSLACMKKNQLKITHPRLFDIYLTLWFRTKFFVFIRLLNVYIWTFLFLYVLPAYYQKFYMNLVLVCQTRLISVFN